VLDRIEDSFAKDISPRMRSRAAHIFAD